MNSFGQFFSVFTNWAYVVYLVLPGYVIYYLIKWALSFASGIGKGSNEEPETQSSSKGKKKDKEKQKVKYMK